MLALWTFAGLIAVIYIFSPSKAKSPETSQQIAAKNPSLDPKAKIALEELIAKGFARIDSRARSVWVDSSVWILSDAEVKRNLSANFALYFAELNRDNHYYCDIYDKQSGKQLAKYDIWGFKVL